MASLREAFDAEVQGVPALGDIDAAIEAVERRRSRLRLAGASFAAAAVIAVLLASGLTAHRADSPPATSPSPSTAVPGVRVEANPPTLSTSPLPGGADAVVRVGNGAGRLIAIAGSQQRTAVSAFRVYTFQLSPDGHFLAWTGNGEPSGDALHVLDLWTGRDVFQAPIQTSAGGSGQAARLEWSLDGGRLVMVTLLTATIDADSIGEVQVFDVGPAGSLSPAAPAVTLPGPYVGIDPAGATVLAESASGTLVSRAVVGGTWTSAGAAAVRSDLPGQQLLPGGAVWMSQGSQRWAPDLARVCSVLVPAGGPSPGSTVGWVVLDTGRVTSQTVPGGSASCLGWSGADLLVQTQRTEGGADVLAIGLDGIAHPLSSYLPPNPGGGDVSLSLATDRPAAGG